MISQDSCNILTALFAVLVALAICTVLMVGIFGPVGGFLYMAIIVMGFGFILCNVR